LSIEKWYKLYLKNGFEPIREAWNSYFNMAGKVVKVQQMDRVIEGVAVGIDADGTFLLQVKSGSVLRIISGDVTI